jgi:hypothetical protein
VPIQEGAKESSSVRSVDAVNGRSVDVADLRNMTRAASVPGISPSARGRQMRLFERELGIELFAAASMHIDTPKDM